MDVRFRPLYNAAYSERLYERYRADLERRLGAPIGFRLAETPVFLPLQFRQRCTAAAGRIIAQLRDPKRLKPMKRAVPPRYDAPGMDASPQFLIVDFAVVRAADGTFEPRLIELQGFPSLLAFETLQRDAWAHVLADLPGLGGEWSCWYSGLGREQLLALGRKMILGRHEPQSVVLVDFDPATQKTSADFFATKQLFGVDSVCVTELRKRGRRLYRELQDRSGREVVVERIYNRMIVDELERKNVQLPFDLRDELDVEWAPHPNWFFVWSKYSMPYLDDATVPKTMFVSELDALPRDLSANWVLKPLFSFAGGGVNVAPTADDIDAIESAERANWCLQEKIEYEPVIPTADGGLAKVEVRMMFLRPDDSTEFVAAENLCRLSRGAMLGVDFNTEVSWVGSSVGIWPANEVA